MGARAARYLNPGTRRLFEDLQLAGPERSPNFAAEASPLCVQSASFPGRGKERIKKKNRNKTTMCVLSHFNRV